MGRLIAQAALAGAVLLAGGCSAGTRVVADSETGVGVFVHAIRGDEQAAYRMAEARCAARAGRASLRLATFRENGQVLHFVCET